MLLYYYLNKLAWYIFRNLGNLWKISNNAYYF